jgi:hypothetical protein
MNKFDVSMWISCVSIHAWQHSGRHLIAFEGDSAIFSVIFASLRDTCILNSWWWGHVTNDLPWSQQGTCGANQQKKNKKNNKEHV